MSTQDLPILSADVRSAAQRLYYRRNLSEFLSRQCTIRTKFIGLQHFAPNPVQALILQGIDNQLKTLGKIRQIWFKGRQVGGSTLGAGIDWHKTSLYSGVYSFIVAQDRTTVGNIFNMIDLFYRNMSSDIKPQRQYFTKGTSIVLGDGVDSTGVNSTVLVGEAKNLSLGVGQTVHVLHMSEVCRYPSSDAIKESLLPACSDYPGTIRILESTAWFGGGAEYFRDQCDRAMAGQSEYQFHFLKWWLQPEYTSPLLKDEKLKLDVEERYLVKKIGLSPENIKWRRQKLSEFQGDIDMFRLSYPTTYEEGWITKLSSTFDWGRLMEMRKDLRPPIKRFHFDQGRLYDVPDGELCIWHMPEKGKTYDVGGDAAEGNEDGDWSVAEVIMRGTNEQVAEYRAHLLPREFGDVLAAIGRMYNNAQVAPEVNHPGNSTLERLVEIYHQIYLWRKRDQIGFKLTNKFGWATTHESKSVMVNLAREKIYYRQTPIHSELLWNELKNFVRDFTPTGQITYKAATGFDDACMAYMIALITSDDENLEKFYKLSVRDEKETQPVKPQVEDAFRDVDGLQFEDKESLLVDTEYWH